MTILEPGDLVAVAASPLLNLGPALSSTAELVHNARLHGSDGTAQPGQVTLRLTGGGTRLTVSFRAAGVSPHQVRLAAVVGSDGRDGLFLCVLKYSGAPGTDFTIDLDIRARRCRLRLGSDSLRTFGLDPDTAGLAVIEGITLQYPPQPKTPEIRLEEGAYLRSRLQAELGAALAASRPKAASAHVALATLYARRIGRGEKLLNRAE